MRFAHYAINSRDLHKPPSIDDAEHSSSQASSVQNLAVSSRNKAAENTDGQIVNQEHCTSSPSSSVSSDLVVIRQDQEVHPEVVMRKISDTHIGSVAAKSQRSSNAEALPDTRISTISSDVYSQSTYDGLYDGILWPDVIDPYHKGQELELRIGGKAIDVFNCKSLTTVTQFRR